MPVPLGRPTQATLYSSTAPLSGALRHRVLELLGQTIRASGQGGKVQVTHPPGSDERHDLDHTSPCASRSGVREMSLTAIGGSGPLRG